MVRGNKICFFYFSTLLPTNIGTYLRPGKFGFFTLVTFRQKLRGFYYIVFLLLLSTKCFAGFDIVKDPWSLAELEMQYEKIVEQLTTLKKQAEDVAKQLIDMDKQIKKLVNSKYDWSSVQKDLTNLSDIISQMQGIAYSAENLDKVFTETFPGYQSKQNYLKQYEEIINKSQSTLNGVLHLVNEVSEDFTKAEKRLNDLKEASESAVGETSAIQAASQIAIEQVEQTELLRQTIMAQANAEVVYYAAELQKEASAKADLDAVVNKGGEQKITGILNSHPIEESKF